MSSPLVTLLILDGFGVGPETRGNAIALARKPNLDALMERFPVVTLQAAGEAVGLPYGEVGNSEVGHLSLGSGTIPYQSLQRINAAIQQGVFAQNERLQKLFQRTLEKNSTLHLIGILSSGGVHGLDRHLYAILEAAKTANVPRIVVHAILDGRDTPKNSGEQYLQELQSRIRNMQNVMIGTISGRFYAMDRDQRWDRTERAYRAIVDAQGRREHDPMSAVETSYARNVFDEEFEPTAFPDYHGMQDGDAILCWNFRPDRMRQLSAAIVNNGFSAFVTTPLGLSVMTMTDYDPSVRVSGVLFPNVTLSEPLAKVLSQHNIAQLHIAETEKYAHITYFFNGGIEEPFPLEQRILIPSPKISSYDTQPEMSAHEVQNAACNAILQDSAQFLVVNFANADMVGHTGNLSASIQAIETLDACVGKVIAEVARKDGIAIMTADHGNAEEMIDIRTGAIDKEHTTNPVPCFVVGSRFERKGTGIRDLWHEEASGVLADAAPTILELFEINPPSTMQGKSLLPILS